MFGLGAGELLVILVVAFLVLGPSQLPKLMRDMGKAIREFRRAADDVRQELAVDDEIRRPLEELRDAVTMHPEDLRIRGAKAKVPPPRLTQPSLLEREPAEAGEKAGTDPESGSEARPLPGQKPS